MIETPGDLAWDLPCVQQASYLEGGPLLWILSLYLHVNKKSDDDVIMYKWVHCIWEGDKSRFLGLFGREIPS